MCVEIYIGSEKELPLVNWNDDSPGFCIYAETGDSVGEFITDKLKSKFYYSAGSYMGCACGLAYGELYRDEDDIRKRDVHAFISYLQKHKLGNDLRLFCFDWNEFPDYYETVEFNLETIDENEFDFEEAKILKVV